MESEPFEWYKYDPDNLAIALSNGFISPQKVIDRKFHYRYLLDYLGEETPDSLAAKTIIVENNYISRAYINDYSAYYSLCFSDNYKKKCKRVHFFNKEFSKEEFIAEIVKESSEIINDDTYLGYIVVKNLPSVVIGATLLKTYNNNSARNYVTRDCDASLFGKTLSFKSLVFQEQDKVVSACATSSLWVAFYKTSVLFQTPLPSPSEITASAKNSYHFSGRIFPNKEGLDHFQIGNAIEKVGLVFELRNKDVNNTNSVNVNNYKLVRSFIYAYSKMGLPVLLGIDIIDKGRHLITVSGFKDEPVKVRRSRSSEEVNLKSEQIEFFYAHDDRIGPYSRLRILNEKPEKAIIETSWWIDTNGNNKYKARVASIIVPLYKKIRITFEDVLNEIRIFNLMFKEKLDKYTLEWDVYLTSSTEYKEEIISNNDLDDSFKQSLVLTQLPKFIWISRLYVEDILIFELVFDSTDVAHGRFCLLMNCYDPGFLEVLNLERLNPKFKKKIKDELYPEYLDMFNALDEKAPTCARLS